MFLNKRGIPSGLFLLLCGLLLALLVAACGDSGSGSKASTPTPAPTATPKPTSPPPTQAPTNSSLTTYSGDGYSIGYPKGWKVKKGDNGLVTFSDPNGIAYMSVDSAPNPGGVVPPSTLLNLGLQAFKSNAKNVKTVSIAPTTTVAGDTWSQESATGDVVPDGQKTPVNLKGVVIADNHPANSPNTRSFTIGYATGTQVFDLANTGFFQPMLQSFKFAASA